MKIKKIKLGLRGRILLVLLFAAAIRAAVMIDYLVEQRDRDVAEARRNLAVQAVNASKELATRIEAAQHLLSGMTQARALEAADRGACSSYLAGVLAGYPQYTGILTVLPDGELHCDSLRTGRQLNLKDRAYFQQAIAGPGIALEPVFGRLTGQGVMQAAMASRDEQGAVKFVLLVSISLDRVAQSVAGSQPYEGTVLTMLDRQGTVLASAESSSSGKRASAKAKPGTSLADTQLGRFALAAADGDTAEFLGPSGVKRIWAAGALPEAWNTGLKLTLGVPEDQLAASAQARAYSVSAGILAATVLIVLIGLALAEWGVRRPLSRILKANARFSGGDLSARIGEPYPGDEIGDLMRELDRGAERGQAQQEEIKRFNVLLEERVRQRTAELEAANEELKAFSYSIAHDMRQPLISMNGYAGLLKKSLAAGSSPDTERYLDRIGAGVRHISELADAMVSLAHLSRTSLQVEEIDLSDMVEDILRGFREREPARLVKATVQPGLTVTGDRQMMRLAMFNLIDNAWKFTSRREWAEIAIGANRANDGTKVFHVRDNGVGFDMAYAGKLFTAFHRLHSPADFPGTGTGLANVSKIISRHRGRIWADATTDVGATFYFTLGRFPET